MAGPAGAGVGVEYKVVGPPKQPGVLEGGVPTGLPHVAPHVREALQ